MPPEDRPGPARVIARFLEEGAPGASRELRLTGRQLLMALSQRLGAESDPTEITVLFADLAGFSRWVLKAGDERGLELLRAVAAVVEPEIASHRGQLVKRLGDGHMAVFAEPIAAIEATLAMHAGLQRVVVEGHRPRLRTGLHTGAPRQVGDDYLGTDVNIAARIGAAARPGELLVSGAVLDAVTAEDRETLRIRRRRGFRAKGTPPDLEVFAVALGSPS